METARARFGSYSRTITCGFGRLFAFCLARDNSSQTASEICFHRCFHNEIKQQIMSRKKKGEKPAETDFSPLLG